MERFYKVFRTGRSRFVNLNQFRTVQHNLSKSESDIEFLPKQDPQISQISSGITVASIENYNPVSHVSIAVKSGARYENEGNLGISHLLRNCAVLSTTNQTAFRLTRSLDHLGAKLSVSSTRDYLFYNLECGRDNIASALEVVSDIVSNPAFKPWEIAAATNNVKLDLAIHAKNPESILMESLHKAAFRGGLSNSMFTETFMIGKHSSEMLHDFVSETFSPGRTSVLGVGIPHDDLQRGVDLFELSGQSSVSEQASKFVPGEIRIESDLPFVHVGIVAEGASASNVKECLSFGVLQCLMGLGTHINDTGSQFSKLGEAAEKKISSPFYVSSLNLNYSGSGLFGVYIVGQPKDMCELVKSVVGQMRGTSKAINDAAVEIAKHKLKAKLFLDQDTSKSLASAAALDLANLGKIQDKAELEKNINDLKTADIQAVAAKIVKAKPAMAAIGRLHKTPHVDELL